MQPLPRFSALPFKFPRIIFRRVSSEGREKDCTSISRERQHALLIMDLASVIAWPVRLISIHTKVSASECSLSHSSIGRLPI